MSAPSKKLPKAQIVALEAIHAVETGADASDRAARAKSDKGVVAIKLGIKRATLFALKARGLIAIERVVVERTTWSGNQSSIHFRFHQDEVLYCKTVSL